MLYTIFIFDKNINMNQILENIKSKSQKRKKYKIQFIVSFLLALCIIIYYFNKKYSEFNYSKISNITNKSYSITRLYSNIISTNFITKDEKSSIIGTIKIAKLGISYPIFSEYSDELLKISVCKFYGPDINSIGNLCIIGHNYNNGNFFSNLYQLNINDTIDIYDSNLSVVSYIIYDIYEVDSYDLTYLSQDTFRRKTNNFSNL